MFNLWDWPSDYAGCRHEYDNGDVYWGEWHQGQRSGAGVMLSRLEYTITKGGERRKERNWKYQGLWVADEKHGLGIRFGRTGPNADVQLNLTQMRAHKKSGGHMKPVPKIDGKMTHQWWGGQWINNSRHGFGYYSAVQEAERYQVVQQKQSEWVISGRQTILEYIVADIGTGYKRLYDFEGAWENDTVTIGAYHDVSEDTRGILNSLNPASDPVNKAIIFSQFAQHIKEMIARKEGGPRSCSTCDEDPAACQGNLRALKLFWICCQQLGLAICVDALHGRLPPNARLISATGEEAQALAPIKPVVAEDTYWVRTTEDGKPAPDIPGTQGIRGARRLP